MTVVTGASGSLGSEICRQLGGDIIAVDVDEYGLWRLSNELGVKTMCDSITRDGLWRELETLDVDTVINCAAVKHVWTSEQHAAWSALVNHASLLHMRGDWKVVQISTDKAVNPLCEYGVQKLVAERHALNMGGVVVRLVNIHNSRGCAEEVFAKQIADGGPVTARDPKMKRYFITVEQAAADVIEVAKNADSGLYMPDPGEPVKMDDIIYTLIGEWDILDIKPPGNIEVVYTGIQDGEKYVEDILTDYEKVEPVEWSKHIQKVVRK